MKVLITGVTGFIAHHVTEHLLNHTDWEIVSIDRIDATSTLHRLRWIKGWPDFAERVKFVWHDLRSPINDGVSRRIGGVDACIHMAASTHVDRSITDPLDFVQDNVVATAHLLEWWRSKWRSHHQFINFSTDEVFGPAPEDKAYKEWDRFNSGNPYSATKAGAEQLVCAYSNTYGFPALTTFTMNVIGERQHPEKFVPLVIGKVLRGEEVTIHANRDCTKSGSRFYLHAANAGAALHWLLDSSKNAVKGYDRLNIVGEQELSNLEMAQKIAAIVGKPLKHKLVDFHSSRPGHDLRYALDGSKLKATGFFYPMNLDESLERTVRWYLEHPEWLGGL